MTFMEKLEQRTGTDDYVNSGVVTSKELDWGTLDFQVVAHGFNDSLSISPKITATRLHMPARCDNLGPHVHPGGELAYVVNGSYYDAAMDGNVLERYDPGSTVFYNKWSTHRPLSEEGAELFYLTFDGIIIPNHGVMHDDAGIKIATKMAELNTPEDAVEYGLQFLFPNERKRTAIRELMDELFKRE